MSLQKLKYENQEEKRFQEISGGNLFHKTDRSIFRLSRLGRTADLRVEIMNDISIINDKDHSVDGYGRGCLHWCAVKCKINTIRMLLQLDNININLQTDYGLTGLMIAAERGDIPMIKLFLQYNANIDVIDNGGFTALHHACRCDRFEAASVLINSGANHTIKDRVS
jgi:ankyrin repeat protein